MFHDNSLIRGLLLAFLVLAGMPSVARGQSPPPKDIHLVFEPDNPVHDGVIRGLAGAIGDTPLYSGIRFVPCPPASAPDACRPPNTERPDLLVSIGSRIFEQVKATEPHRNTIAALIPGVTFEALTLDLPAGQHERFNAILVEQDPARQLRLARVLLPDLSRAGIVVSKDPERVVRQLTRQSAKPAPQVFYEHVSDFSEVALCFERVLDKVEALIALPDPVLLNRNNTKWLLYMAANRGIPVFGYSSAYVRAGALAAVFSTPEQVGRQLAAEITRWSRQGWDSQRRVVYATEFNVETNATVARRLGVELPSGRALMKQLVTEGHTDEKQ